MLVKILSCFIKERIKGTKNRIALNVIDNIKILGIISLKYVWVICVAKAIAMNIKYHSRSEERRVGKEC